MPTPEELEVGTSVDNGQIVREPKTTPRTTPPLPESSDSDLESIDHLSDAEQFERAMTQFRAVLESPALLRIVECWGKRIDAEPDRAKLEFDLKSRAQQFNAKLAASNRIYFLIGLGVCLAFLGVVVWLLKGDKDTLLPVLTAIVGLLAAGTGGGFIFGQVKRE